MKTSELTGTALDWAVTKCEGFDHEVTSSEWGMWGWATDWAQGGPIIEREKIDTRNTFTEGGYRTSESVDAVAACIRLPNGATAYAPDKAVFEYGPTPLIAAMRCYVASKLGDTINIPKELQ